MKRRKNKVPALLLVAVLIAVGQAVQEDQNDSQHLTANPVPFDQWPKSGQGQSEKNSDLTQSKDTKTGDIMWPDQFRTVPKNIVDGQEISNADSSENEIGPQSESESKSGSRPKFQLKNTGTKELDTKKGDEGQSGLGQGHGKAVETFQSKVTLETADAVQNDAVTTQTAPVATENDPTVEKAETVQNSVTVKNGQSPATTGVTFDPADDGQTGQKTETEQIGEIVKVDQTTENGQNGQIFSTEKTAENSQIDQNDQIFDIDRIAKIGQAAENQQNVGTDQTAEKGQNDQIFDIDRIAKIGETVDRKNADTVRNAENGQNGQTGGNGQNGQTGRNGQNGQTGGNGQTVENGQNDQTDPADQTLENVTASLTGENGQTDQPVQHGQNLENDPKIALLTPSLDGDPNPGSTENPPTSSETAFLTYQGKMDKVQAIDEETVEKAAAQPQQQQQSSDNKDESEETFLSWKNVNKAPSPESDQKPVQNQEQSHPLRRHRNRQRFWGRGGIRGRGRGRGRDKYRAYILRKQRGRKNHNKRGKLGGNGPEDSHVHNNKACGQVSCTPPPDNAENCEMMKTAIHVPRRSRFHKLQHCCPVWLCTKKTDGSFFTHYGMTSLKTTTIFHEESTVKTDVKSPSATDTSSDFNFPAAPEKIDIPSETPSEAPELSELPEEANSTPKSLENPDSDSTSTGSVLETEESSSASASASASAAASDSPGEGGSETSKNFVAQSSTYYKYNENVDHGIVPQLIPVNNQNQGDQNQIKNPGFTRDLNYDGNPRRINIHVPQQNQQQSPTPFIQSFNSFRPPFPELNNGPRPNPPTLNLNLNRVPLQTHHQNFDQTFAHFSRPQLPLGNFGNFAPRIPTQNFHVGMEFQRPAPAFRNDDAFAVFDAPNFPFVNPFDPSTFGFPANPAPARTPQQSGNRRAL